MPGLLAGDLGIRLPALELLLARARRSSGEAATLEHWLFDAFGAEPAAGAYSVAGSGGDAGTASWMRADPVHLRLMRDRMTLVPGEALQISDEEALELAAALKNLLEVRIVAPGKWCAPCSISVPADAALEAAGREIPLSRERDALLTEIQMLLHEHPVNEAREARGEVPVNSLWLWGGGAAATLKPPPWQGLLADDPLALGLARTAGTRHQKLPRSASAWLERAPEEGRHLVIVDTLRAPAAFGDETLLAQELERLEREWFAPLLQALRTGRIGMLSLQVPDGASACTFEVVRGDLRRFWRRPKPLAAHA